VAAVPLDGSDFERLLAEAAAHPIEGWDFSWLGSRVATTGLPWDYDAVVLAHARESSDLLDLGTGGGEWLAGLPHRPARTVATEAWEPNVDVAGRRLRPLGVTVVRDEGAPDNAEQASDESRGLLPFPSASFELVTSRHEAFVATEVARVLVSGGRFVTQQLGSGGEDFHRMLGLELPPGPSRSWNLALAVEQVEAAGLEVVESAEDAQVVTFADVGAVAWHLAAVPWAVPGFLIHTHREELRRLHERIEADGPVSIHQPAFWLEATKP
jgi:SAM-dependent methyltransferase